VCEWIGVHTGELRIAGNGGCVAVGKTWEGPGASLGLLDELWLWADAAAYAVGREFEL